MAYTLGGIMLVVTMLGLAAAYGVGALAGRQPPAPALDSHAPRLTRTLVGKQMSIPTTWFRSIEAKAGGFSSQIQLALTLPLGRNKAPVSIDVTLLPLSQVRPSASLLDGVYLHQFMPNELAGPPGLVGKPLYGSDGFEDETVWYDALSQNPFVAKCMAAPDDAGPARCLRTVALSRGIAAVYSFDFDALYSWRDFDPEMRAWLGRIDAL